MPIFPITYPKTAQKLGKINKLNKTTDTLVIFIKCQTCNLMFKKVDKMFGVG